MISKNPKVDKVFVYEKDDYREILKKSKLAFVREVHSALNEIKKEQFDLVIDLSLNAHVSFFMWLIGIKRRLGFNYKNRSPFLTDKIRLKGYEGRHVVEYYLSLLGPFGVSTTEKNLEINIDSDDTKWADDFLKSNHVAKDDSVIAIVPGGGASWGKDAVYKRWPAKKYASLSDKIVEKFKAKIIFLGDSAERELCYNIAQDMQHKPIQACGETTVGEMAALLARSKLAIVNDGGPLHISVAAGAKTVSIFGPVDEDVYGPYPKNNHVVIANDIACRPCYRRFKKADCEHHNCLNQITVDDVLKGAQEAL